MNLPTFQYDNRQQIRGPYGNNYPGPPEPFFWAQVLDSFTFACPQQASGSFGVPVSGATDNVTGYVWQEVWPIGCGLYAVRGDRDKIGGYEETFNSVTRRTKILFERNQKVIPVGSIVRAEWAFEDDFHGPMYDCDWAAGGGTAGSGSQNNCELTGFTIDCEDETITPDGSIRILHAFEDGDPLLMLMNEGAGIGFGTVTGGVIGTTAAEKFAFWGATPAVQDTGWSVTNYTAATKTLDGSTATLADVINFLGTLSEELLKTRLGLKGS